MRSWLKMCVCSVLLPCLASAAIPALASEAGSAVANTSAPAAASKRDIRYVVMHFPGPKWQHNKSVFEQEGLDLHVAHYRKLFAAGKLIAGGPFMDAAAGGMMVPEAGLAEAEIRAFALADPAVQAGLLTVEIRTWLVGMKK